MYKSCQVLLKNYLEELMYSPGYKPVISQYTRGLS